MLDMAIISFDGQWGIIEHLFCPTKDKILSSIQTFICLGPFSIKVLELQAAWHVVMLYKLADNKHDKITAKPVSSLSFILGWLLGVSW